MLTYTRWRAERYESAMAALFLLERLQIPIWYQPPDNLRLACREDQLTWTLRQRLAEAKPELVELLRERVPN